MCTWKLWLQIDFIKVTVTNESDYTQVNLTEAPLTDFVEVNITEVALS